jgi:hypothetical protein
VQCICATTASTATILCSHDDRSSPWKCSLTIEQSIIGDTLVMIDAALLADRTVDRKHARLGRERRAVSLKTGSWHRRAGSR